MAHKLTALQHPEVRFEVTNKCNAACVMCPREKQTRPQGVMDMDAYLTTLAEVAHLGCRYTVFNHFGEPLLDPDLELRIGAAKALNLNTYFITNASLLTVERSAALIRHGLDEIRISFHGATKASYEAAMRHLDFERAMRNVVSLVAERRRLSSTTPKIYLTFLVLPETEQDVERWRTIFTPMVDALDIWRPHNFGDGRDYRARAGKKTSCGRPSNGPLQIQWDGTVVPCCYDYNNAIPLGNVFRDGVLGALNSDSYKLLRWVHENGEFWREPYCDQCDQLLPHEDALVSTTRHGLIPAEAVKRSNTDNSRLTYD